MSTLKELAALAGVSTTTVSVVLRGEADLRKISKTTQKKVLDAAKSVGYQTNLAARRLRTVGGKRTVIALYWATDFRAPMMVRFLHGLQRVIVNDSHRVDIIIRPYTNGCLNEVTSPQDLGMYNAAIICNASQKDLEELERTTLFIPIVLYNRHSHKFCTVTIDDYQLGSKPAHIFASRGHKNAAIITSKPVFTNMQLRTSGFIKTGLSLGLKTTNVVYQHNSMGGGFEGASMLCKLAEKPDCIFFGSDAMAMGAMRAFVRYGIKIPQDMECISVGNGDRDQEEFAITSLSNVQIPMEDMAEKCLQLLLKILDGDINETYSCEFPVIYHQLESCGANLEPKIE